MAPNKRIKSFQSEFTNFDSNLFRLTYGKGKKDRHFEFTGFRFDNLVPLLARVYQHKLQVWTHLQLWFYSHSGNGFVSKESVTQQPLQGRKAHLACLHT